MARGHLDLVLDIPSKVLEMTTGKTDATVGRREPPHCEGLGRKSATMSNSTRVAIRK